MAEKRTINIDINNNADEAAKDFKNFAKATNIANDSVEGLNKTFEEVYGELQPLTTRMGEAEDRLYELALAGDTTSKEYQELLTKVGDYRKVQIQTDLAVDSAATTLGQKLGGALTGATSGFAAVQGVMGLVGGESEQLEKALLKVQSALAIQQGVQGIREAIPAFKQLGTTAIKALKGIKTGIAATGVGLLVVAVGAIVAYWEDITELLGVNNQSLEEQLELEKQIEEEKQKQLQTMNEIVSENQSFIDRQIQIVKNEEKLKDLGIDSEKNAKAIQELTKENIRLELLNLQTRLTSTEELLNTQEKLQIKSEIYRKQQELLRIDEQALFDQRQKNAEAQAKKDEALKKLNEEVQKAFEERIDTENKILQEGVDFLKEANFEEVESTFNKYAAMGALSMEYHKKEQERRERNKEFAINSAFETLDLISNITELFGKKGEKQAKRAFEVQKAAQIATTLGTTYLSATQAYASQFLPLPDPSSPVRGGIAAGLAVAAGLANVAKIASQKFEGGGATGGTSVSGSVPDAPSAPQFNVVGDSGVNQLAQLQQQPTQAYVVSGEVTTAQALDRNRVQNATL